ncbi:MAG TPA: hypothetical protein VF915_19700, partial [Reyranella sp.]
MAVEISYPGVYVEEISSGAHPIEGVPTSIAAFIGVATAGSLNQPTHVRSHGDFECLFGQPTSPLSDAV